jgi:hypothetical protein
MRRPTIVAMLILSVSCGSHAIPPAGGLEGRVTIGPTCPVELAGSPCPPGIWSGTVRATSTDGDAHETTTGSDGSFQLALAPGTYTVTPVTNGGPPTPKPVTVAVGTTVQHLDLQVDSGIR